MGATIFTYTFPFREPESQELILRRVLSTVEGTWFAHSLGFGDPTSKFVKSSANNDLSILLPVPYPDLENSHLPFSFTPEVAYIRVSRRKPSTDKEEISIKLWFIKSSIEEYEELAHTGRISGLVALALTSLQVSETTADAAMSFMPHQNELVGVSHFSEQSKRSVHKIEIMKRIGSIIGECLWERYAEHLTEKVMPGAPVGFRLFRIHGNSLKTEYANSQFVGAYHHDCLIVCEELVYEVGREAIPRYAIIPVSTFSHSIYNGVGASRELGLDLLNAPGISNYMRMRPSLAAPMGESMNLALNEAIGFARSKYGDSGVS